MQLSAEQTGRFQTRWRISGQLTTTTPMHIGSGNVTHRKQLTVSKNQSAGTPQGRFAEVSAVCVDASGSPYIPGRAIKDNLRAWLRVAAGDQSQLIERVFGSEANDEVAPPEKKEIAGRAEFWDARLRTHASGKGIPYWDSQRGTGVRSRTAIARRTRTVQEDKLFYIEYVPPGTSFDLNITAQGLSEREVAFLLFALDGFENHSCPEFRVRLGAAQDDFWGELKWATPPRVRAIRSREEALAWVSKDLAAGYEGFDEVPADIYSEILKEKQSFVAAGPEIITINLRLTLASPLLVNDPAFAKPKGAKDKDSKLASAAAFRNGDGLVAVPADSFRGALRSQAERILRTQGKPACYATDPAGACEPVYDLDEVRRLCEACHLFGAPGWGTALRITDFVEVPNKRSQPFHQEFVAMDRFTGGGAPGLKFNADSQFGPTLEGKLVVETGRISRESQTLIALVLRDLFEGDIPLGSWCGKGYGALTGGIQSISGSRSDDATANLKVLLSASIEPDEIPDHVVRQVEVRNADTPAHTATDGAFHNPYHFVPAVSGAITDALGVDAFAVHSKAGPDQPLHLTHDRYVRGSETKPMYSGRIICRLENEKEMVIGAEQVGETDPKTVKPFEIDGRPAIPGSSLRGLISSIAEAASNSAMRVLSNTAFSRRVDFADRKKLDAIGIVRTKPDGPGWELLPLTLPTMQWDPHQSEGRLDDARIFAGANLRVYVDGYKSGRIIPGSFLADHSPRSYSADNRNEYWYMKLGSTNKRFVGSSLRVSPSNPRHKNQRFLVGQRPSDANGAPISEDDWKRLPAEERGLYTKGILRVLGINGRETEIPTGKMHEIFVPLPPTMKGLPWLDATNAVERFHRLAGQRTEADDQLPFELKGSKRNSDPSHGAAIELRTGDLVFFRAENGEIEEVAISSIWRKEVGDCHKFFGAINSELLPFNRQRRSISIAEQMFGFVEQNLDDPTRPDTSARALASRLRFSFGLLDDCSHFDQSGIPSFYSPGGTTRIPSSPKPPSPSLYFRKRIGSGGIAKQDLKPEDRLPLGRKFYLHHRGAGTWKTNAPAERLEQKVQVTPVRPNMGFYFHVDFDNLSERELSLLCYALRPTDQFRHKLGMGKPFGLGTVRIDPVAMLFVSRHDRYQFASDGPLDSQRYHFGSAQEPNEVERLPSRYQRERQWIEKHRIEGQEIIPFEGWNGKSFSNLRDEFRSSMNREIRVALERIGDPASVSHPVHYPVQRDQTGELEGFKWFMQNDQLPDTQKQQLTPIRENQTTLPTLRRN
jgi:CRISPR-associated protein (TIGR03986 family)